MVNGTGLTSGSIAKPMGMETGIGNELGGGVSEGDPGLMDLRRGYGKFP